MLTKTHLKYKMRAGRVIPAFVDAADAALLKLAEQLTELFQGSTGQTGGELEEASDLIVEALGIRQDIAQGLVKLLLDRCDEQIEDSQIEERRWVLLAAAQKVRLNAAALDPSTMRAAVAREIGLADGAGEGIPETLYGDLPALRKITGFKKIAPKELLERYNCAQVQGLLLQARHLVITVTEASLSERRSLFRLLKFHRLMAEVEAGEMAKGSKSLTFTLSGPLSLFDQAQSYGLRLANFFPHILHLPRWSLEAEVHLKKKNVVLKLDQKAGLVSPYQKMKPYVPDELTACLSLFNKQNEVWSAAAADEFVHIGRQSYCFPDLTLSSAKGQKLHIELFHRWHVGQLQGRLEALEKSSISEFYVGISKALQKNPKVTELLKDSPWFARNGFVFGEFPTPKHLTSVIALGKSET